MSPIVMQAMLTRTIMSPWIAPKLYPRHEYVSDEYLTEAQLVARDSNGTITWMTLHTWYPSTGIEPRIKAVLVFNELSKVLDYSITILRKN